MALAPGVYRTACKLCGIEGSIRIRKGSVKGDNVRIDDMIAHAEGCAMAPKEQPKHLKNRRTWELQEKRANDLVGARATLASGAVGLDGDGRKFREWRVESKQTKYARYVLRQSIWTKLVDGALRAGEEPLLHLEMDGSERRVIVRKDWYDAIRPHEPPFTRGGKKNAQSYSLDVSISTPHLVELEPLGVMLYEAEFKRIRGQDGST